MCAGLSDRVTYAPFHLFSLAEAVAAKALRTRGPALVQHCADHLARAYPSPLRVDSSNFLPHHLWAKGVQLVALNLQTYGASVLALGG
jgi:phosphatidylinositol phospholipase C delta